MNHNHQIVNSPQFARQKIDQGKESPQGRMQEETAGREDYGARNEEHQLRRLNLTNRVSTGTTRSRLQLRKGTCLRLLFSSTTIILQSRRRAIADLAERYRGDFFEKEGV